MSLLNEQPTSGEQIKSVYNYTNISQFLGDMLGEKKKKNPAFSARAWSKRLGFKNSSLLVDILNGRRKIKPDLGSQIAEELALSENERAYYDILVLSCSTKTKRERIFYDGLLRDLKPDRNRSDLRLSHFRFVSDWYHFTLLASLSLKDFKNDPIYLAKRLGGRLTPETIRLAFQRLKELGLVKVIGSKLVRGEGNPVLKDEVPSSAVKSHHRQILTRAREALMEQAVEERDFRSSQFSFRKENYAAAKELVRGFHRSIQKLSENDGAGDEVYVFNTQFFKLTREIGN